MNPPLPHHGEIWWAEVPGDKVRPVLVLTRERFIARLHSVLVAPVTSRVRQIPTEVPLNEQDGLPHACAVNFDNVFTLRRERLRERITVLRTDRWDEVCRSYRFAIGC
ncbi:MAG TPA: type II toxin-antitoxin system PemK/MazF family toxin [Pseudonocardiaceae bacterium]|nr:type II toxin-antitoxin system PemK/MazF family toxin [Pseudonocardiaceae bacterium]